jgi:hypothetical protein
MYLPDGSSALPSEQQFTLESIPTLRNTPNGTSLIIRASIDRRNNSSNAFGFLRRLIALIQFPFLVEWAPIPL